MADFAAAGARDGDAGEEARRVLFEARRAFQEAVARVVGEGAQARDEGGVDGAAAFLGLLPLGGDALHEWTAAFPWG